MTAEDAVHAKSYDFSFSESDIINCGSICHCYFSCRVVEEYFLPRMIQEVTGQVKEIQNIVVSPSMRFWTAKEQTLDVFFFNLLLPCSTGDRSLWWLCSVYKRHVYRIWDLCRTLAPQKVTKTDCIVPVWKTVCVMYKIASFFLAPMFRWGQMVLKFLRTLLLATMSYAKLTQGSL